MIVIQCLVFFGDYKLNPNLLIFEIENDINANRATDSPIAITSDGFDTIFLGTDTRILMISADGKVYKRIFTISDTEVIYMIMKNKHKIFYF